MEGRDDQKHPTRPRARPVGFYEESDDEEDAPARHEERDDDYDAAVDDVSEEVEEEATDDGSDDEYTERLRDAKDTIEAQLGLGYAEQARAVRAFSFFSAWMRNDGVAAAIQALHIRGLAAADAAAAATIGAAAVADLAVPSSAALQAFGPLCALQSGAWQDVLLHLSEVLSTAMALEAAVAIRDAKQRFAGGAHSAVVRLLFAEREIHDDNFVELLLEQTRPEALQEAARSVRALVQRSVCRLSPEALLRCVIRRLVAAWQAAVDEGVAERWVSASSAPCARHRTNTALYDSWRPRGVKDMVESTQGLCFVSTYICTYDDQTSWVASRCARLYGAPAAGTPAFYEQRQTLLLNRRAILPLHSGSYTYCCQRAVTDALNAILAKGRLGEAVQAATSVFVASRTDRTASLHGLGKVSSAQRRSVKWMVLPAKRVPDGTTAAAWLTPPYLLPEEKGRGAAVVTFYVLLNEEPRASPSGSYGDELAPYLDAETRTICKGARRDTKTARNWLARGTGEERRDEDYAAAAAFLSSM